MKSASTCIRGGAVRDCLTLVLSFLCVAPVGFAQQVSEEQAIAPVRSRAPVFIRPYKAPFVPPVNLSGTGRVASLVRAGKLYLTVQDAIALAIENNIDVEVARFQSILDSWNLERAEAGGALPGAPSASTQATSVTRGQGVRGSQAAAGVGSGGNNNNNGNTVNGTITQIGPVTPNLDPVFQDTTTFAHSSNPQANPTQGLVSNLIDKQRNYAVSLQDGFLTGTQATISYTESYLNENAPSNILNPEYAPILQANIQQNFLLGFGTAVNSRTINVAKLNLTLDDLNFKSQLISIVANVLNLYYGLVADYDDLKAKQSALTVAQQFYENNRRQVQLGSLAPLDITTAEAQVASSQQDLVTSQTTLQTQQVSLKNVLSRKGTADPLLAEVEIIPLDRIDIPEQDTLPPLKDLMAKALKNRVDIASEKLHLKVDQLNNLGTENGLLPRLVGQVSASSQGLSGTPQFVLTRSGQVAQDASQQFPPGFTACPPPNTGRVCETADSTFKGGVDNAVGQIFRRDFPTQSASSFFVATLRNRQNQADYAIDQLSYRQDQLTTQRDINQVAVDVSNQVVALQQARVRYLAAVKNRVLEQQLLDAEQKKFALGASTPFNVVTQQRDLAAAQSTETASQVAYSNATIALGEIVGTTLEDTHVSMDEAKSGHVARQSVIPASVPNRP